jgi:putative PEP-CTERM system TPR-repeat lipoprotein
MKRLHGTPLRRALRPALLALTIGLGFAASPALAASYYEDALKRFEAQDYPAAIIQLKNALRHEPNKLAIQFLLGRALQQNGDVVGAEVAYNEALRLGISRSEAAVPLAQAIIAQGRLREMLAHPQLQPSGLPTDVLQDLLLLRASAHTDMGDSREALSAIEQARALNDRRADVWLAEVPVRVRARQFAEALRAAERGLTVAPNDAQSHYVKGSVHHVQGRLDAALADYAQALRLDPKHAETLIARAGIFIDRNQLPDAVQALQQLLIAAPKEPRAAYLRALVAERENRPEQARAALLEVTQLLDPVPPAYMQYRPQLLMLNGLSHFGLNQTAKARQYLEAFLKVQPNSPVVRLLARIQMSEGNTALAIPLLETYLRSQPDDGLALSLLGSAYMTQGKSARATQILQEALKKQDRPEYRTALGLSLLGGGQTEGAMVELETAWRQDPGQVSAGVSLTQLYLQQNRLPQALTLARDLTRRYPAHAGLHNLLGDVLQRSGQTAPARQAYEKALSLDPKLPAARLQLARLDVASNQIAAAEQRLTALLRDTPRNSDAMAEMARISERKGQHDEALRWLLRARDASDRKDMRWNRALMALNLQQGKPQQALEEGKIALAKQPNDLPSLLLYARAQLALGDVNGARGTLSGATRLADYNAPQQTEIAQLQLAAGSVDGAAYSLSKALSDQPNFIPAQALMVQVEQRQGSPDKAEARARQIVQRQPNKALGHSLLGELALARSQPAAAIAAFRQAHRVEPSAASALTLMNALASQNQADEALSIGRQHLRQSPGDVAVHLLVGDLHARASRYGDAAIAYQAALKLQPQNAQALNNLANAQLRFKDPAALATAQAAHKLAPQNPFVIDTLGWVLFQQGQTEQALPLLRDARLRAPGNPEIRYHLARVLWATGRQAEAREEAREALKISDRFDGAADAQRLLGGQP